MVCSWAPETPSETETVRGVESDLRPSLGDLGPRHHMLLVNIKDQDQAKPRTRVSGCSGKKTMNKCIYIYTWTFQGVSNGGPLVVGWGFHWAPLGRSWYIEFSAECKASNILKTAEHRFSHRSPDVLDEKEQHDKPRVPEDVAHHGEGVNLSLTVFPSGSSGSTMSLVFPVVPKTKNHRPRNLWSLGFTVCSRHLLSQRLQVEHLLLTTWAVV